MTEGTTKVESTIKEEDEEDGADEDEGLKKEQTGSASNKRAHQVDDDEDNYKPLVDIDYPVHVFPLDIFPTAFIDKHTGKNVYVPEYVIQPLLYNNGVVTNSTLLSYCICPSICNTLTCAPCCIALFTTVTATVSACAPNISQDVCNCDRIFPSQDWCSSSSRSPLDCCACCMSTSAAPVCSLSDLGCGDCIGNTTAPSCDCVGIITQTITHAQNNVISCYEGGVQSIVSCYEGSIHCVVNSYANCQAMTPTCNQHQVLYNELYMCYRSVTSCC